MTETNLAQAVDMTDNPGPAYDANVKLLLADKQILARILKYAVTEFQDMAIEDIISGIGDDIETGTRLVDAGLSNLGRARESVTEDNVPGEGKIFFDIRFTAYHREAEMKFLINIEAQKSSDPGRLGYHLENRILFYLARMISAQKQTEFFHSDYDSLKKVRSIWICMDGRADSDSIEEIGLDRKTVFGNKRDTYGIDLMKGIIINIRSGKNVRDSQNILISLLENLLSQMAPAEKKRILTEKYGMIMTVELEGRIQTMCNLSENIEAEAIERGIERGIEKGIEKGVKKERLAAIGRMIRAGAPKGQIISFGYTEDEFTQAENALYINS